MRNLIDYLKIIQMKRYGLSIGLMVRTKEDSFVQFSTVREYHVSLC
jgi:hypothetical protein